MEKRILGRTGLEVSVLGVGGGAFSGKEPDRVLAACRAAFKGGVSLVDTAQDYGEEKLRDALSGWPEVFVVSKSTALAAEEMFAAVSRSVELLGRVDIYLIQTLMSSEDLKQRISRGVLDALREARKKGAIKFVGASGHRIPVLIEAVQTGLFDVIEAPYSIGQRRSEDLTSAAAKAGAGFIAMLSLGGGVLVDRDRKCAAAGHMNSANALSWVLSNKAVSCAIVGMSDPEHVQINLQAARLLRKLDRAARDRIEEEAGRFLGKPYCMSCKACMPCDDLGWAFDIDNFFRFHAWYSKYGYSQFKAEYAKLPLKANACTRCGKCEPRCPYGVPIMARLEEVHRELGQ